MLKSDARQSSFRILLVFGAALAVTVLAGERQVRAQSNECLVEVHQDDQDATVAEGAELCMDAVNKSCIFPLKLCLNGDANGCSPATIKGKKVKATGHCGPVGKLFVQPSGNSSVCGSVFGIKVKTKKQGKRPGRCNLRIAGRSTDKPPRVDIDKVRLVCMPPGGCPATTSTTTTSPGGTTTSTTMAPPCPVGSSCCSSLPSLFSFNTGSSGCGTNPPGSVTPAKCVGGTSAGTDCTSDANCPGGVCRGALVCTGLYFGGGQPAGIQLPGTVPDNGLSYSKVASCDASGNPLLTPAAAADVPAGCAGQPGTPTYGQRHCTSPGCLFGAPLAIPNPASSATGTCVLNVIANKPGVGTGDVSCSTGASNVTLPLDSKIYLTGSIEPVRVCSTCVGGTTGVCGSGTCMGGPRNGMACTPETSALNGSYPTSHDCPPPNFPADGGTCGTPSPGTSFIGCLPIGFNLTTGTQTKMSFNTSAQQRVICGFCFDGTATFAYENPPHECSSDAQCTNGDFTQCRQHSPGAFRNTFATAVTETGSSPNTCIADGTARNATLVSVFCIPPSYDPIVDPSGELPGPGAVSLPGVAQFIP